MIRLIAPRRFWTVLAALAICGGLLWRVAAARGGRNAAPPCASPHEEFFLSSVILRADRVYSHNPEGGPQIRGGPLYTTFLALTQAGARRPERSRAYAAQALLGALAALAAWGLGARLRSPAAGALAAAGVALNPELVRSVTSLDVHGFYGVVVLLLACAAARWAERRGDRASSAVFGAALGVSLLCRSAHLAFIPLLAAGAWAWWGASGLRRAALVLAVAAAVLLPWTIRNYVHARRFVPLEVDMGSYNLVAAAVGVDHALGGDEAFAIAERLEPGFQSRHAADSISQRERALLGVAVRAILRSPGLFLFGSLRRAAAFWRPLWALAALAAFAALAPGASAGIQAAALLAAAFSLYGVIGLGAGYRLCVEPLLTALAAVGLARLSGLPPPRESGPDPLRLALPAAAAVGAAALACLLLTPLDALAQRPAGKPRCDEPAPFLLAFLDDGDRACSGKWALAGEAGALRARALMCAGMSASAAGDGARAREDLAEAESLDLDADSRFQIALRYQELKDYPSALRVLDGLVRRYPANGDFRGARGLCLYLGGSPRDSEADLEAAIKLTPDSLSAYLTLGAVYSASARYGAAVAVYDRALAAGAARGSADLRRQILGGRESALLKLRGRVN